VEVVQTFILVEVEEPEDIELLYLEDQKLI
jgi:hypothetical protein